MAISLLQLCTNAERKYSMKLIAGSAGLENTVRWVHMVEDSEVPDFLHGNELIFTTGIGHTGSDWLRNFTVSLRNKGAVGLVLNIGPYITYVPSQVIVFCEQNGFPLFTMPWETKIIDISYDFCRRIIANEKKESSVADAFRTIIKAPEKCSDFADVLKHSGFRTNSSYTVIVVSIFKGEKPVTESIVRSSDMTLWRTLKHSKQPSALFMLGNQLIAIRQNCTNEEIDNFCESIRPITEAESDMRSYIGISDRVTGYSDVSSAYKQAEAAMDTARIKSADRKFYSDIGVMKVLFGVTDKKILEAFVEETLGTLIDYDDIHDTSLCSLLRQYIEMNGSVNEAAAAAGVHRNTINHKIKNIREILGTELDDKTKNKLMLAYLSRDVLEIYKNPFS